MSLTAAHTLRGKFGFSDFRPGQAEVILENFTYGDTPEPEALPHLLKDVLARAGSRRAVRRLYA